MGHFAMQAAVTWRRISRGSQIHLSNEKVQSNVLTRVFTTSVATQCKQWFFQSPLMWRYLYRLKYDEACDSQKQSPRKRHFGSPRKRLDHFFGDTITKKAFRLPSVNSLSPLTLANFGFNRKPTNRFHQRFTNSISKYLLLGSRVPTVEITSRPRVVDNCAFIGFCVLDWAVPRATKII